MLQQSDQNFAIIYCLLVMVAVLPDVTFSIKCMVCHDYEEGCSEGKGPVLDCKESFGAQLNECLKTELIGKFTTLQQIA